MCVFIKGAPPPGRFNPPIASTAVCEGDRYSGGLNTSDSLAKSKHSAIPRRLLYGNISQIVTESQKGEIRKRLPEAKHDIIYPGSNQGQKDLNIDVRHGARVGGRSYWKITMGCNPTLNSKQLHQISNSERIISTEKTKVRPSQVRRIVSKSRSIYPQKVFATKMPSRGAGAWLFNAMIKPEDQQTSGSEERPIAVEGLSLEEKAMMWATGKVMPVKKEKSEEHDTEGLCLEEIATGMGVWNTYI